MTAKKTYEELMEGWQLRRMKADDRWLAKRERQERDAERMIGELCKEGKTVFYVYPVGGKYREGTRSELIDFLIRNRYV